MDDWAHVRLRYRRGNAPGSMFYVYLLASKPYGTLYVGTTSDLARRVWEHKNKVVSGFTKRTALIVWFGSRFTMWQRRRCAERSKSRNGNETGRSI